MRDLKIESMKRRRLRLTLKFLKYSFATSQDRILNSAVWDSVVMWIEGNTGCMSSLVQPLERQEVFTMPHRGDGIPTAEALAQAADKALCLGVLTDNSRPSLALIILNRLIISCHHPYGLNNDLGHISRVFSTGRPWTCTIILDSPKHPNGPLVSSRRPNGFSNVLVMPNGFSTVHQSLQLPRSLWSRQHAPGQLRSFPMVLGRSQWSPTFHGTSGLF